MRDTIKPQDYFLARIQADTARIKRFEETLKNTEPSNERGIRLGKSQLSKLYLDCAKTSYSMGAELGEVYYTAAKQALANKENFVATGNYYFIEKICRLLDEYGVQYIIKVGRL